MWGNTHVHTFWMRTFLDSQKRTFVSTFWTRCKAFVCIFWSWSKNCAHILNAYILDSNRTTFVQNFICKAAVFTHLNARSSSCTHTLCNPSKDFFPNILDKDFFSKHTRRKKAKFVFTYFETFLNTTVQLKYNWFTIFCILSTSNSSHGSPFHVSRLDVFLFSWFRSGHKNKDHFVPQK